MEDEEKIDPAYLKGFNEGYIIAQNMPKLADQLANVNSDSLRMAGFKAGREQFTLERMKDRLPSWLKSDQTLRELGTHEKFKGRDIEPDKE